MKLRNLLFIGIGIIAGFAAPALADLNYTQGNGTTIFDFLCFTTKHCSAHVPVNSAGTEIATNTNPIRIDPTGTTTQPISAASGGVASGAMVDLGTQADAACATDNGSCSAIALIKRGNQDLTVLNTTSGASIAAGTNTVGNMGIDPSSGKATPNFAFLPMPATTTTQIVAASGSTKIYVTSLFALAGGTVNMTFKYGTGANCGTGTTTLTGPFTLTTQTGFTEGSGTGAVIIVPASQALCITTDASVTGGIHMTYQQF